MNVLNVRRFDLLSASVVFYFINWSVIAVHCCILRRINKRKIIMNRFHLVRSYRAMRSNLMWAMNKQSRRTVNFCVMKVQKPLVNEAFNANKCCMCSILLLSVTVSAENDFDKSHFQTVSCHISSGIRAQLCIHKNSRLTLRRESKKANERISACRGCTASVVLSFRISVYRWFSN